jgi:acyl-CoA synthetase (AMP-forming)/AMP-acid ligase II
MLPPYMIPSEVRFVANLPLNSNGKVDYKALAEDLERPAAPPEPDGAFARTR